MKNLGLAAVTLCCLTLTAFAVPAAGWISSRPPRSTQIRLANADDLASEAALRHQRGEPRHWRALLLHR